MEYSPLAQPQSLLSFPKLGGVPNDLAHLRCGEKQAIIIQTHGLDFGHVAPLDLGIPAKDKDLTLQEGGYAIADGVDPVPGFALCSEEFGVPEMPGFPSMVRIVHVMATSNLSQISFAIALTASVKISMHTRSVHMDHALSDQSEILPVADVGSRGPECPQPQAPC
ncbi:hypothetical protein BDW72DRAFT_54478 [Aspergillus terricola var. indicus]